VPTLPSGGGGASAWVSEDTDPADKPVRYPTIEALWPAGPRPSRRTPGGYSRGIERPAAL